MELKQSERVNVSWKTLNGISLFVISDQRNGVHFHPGSRLFKIVPEATNDHSLLHRHSVWSPRSRFAVVSSTRWVALFSILICKQEPFATRCVWAVWSWIWFPRIGHISNVQHNESCWKWVTKGKIRRSICVSVFIFVWFHGVVAIYEKLIAREGNLRRPSSTEVVSCSGTYPSVSYSSKNPLSPNLWE